MMTTHEVIEEEKRWQIKFTELNKLYYTSLLTGFSLASAVAIHPLIFITVRQQSGMNSRMDGSASSSSSKQLLSHLREVGVRGMYRGCSPLLLMGVPTSLVYFMAYESSKEFIDKSVSNIHPTISPTALDFTQAISSSIYCNSLSLLLYIPAEVISSRMIIDYKGYGATQMLKQVYVSQGIRGLYRGYSPGLVAAIITSSAWWSAYNISRRYVSPKIYRDRPYLVDGMCGFTAGLVEICCSHPFETLKTRIMTGACRHQSTVQSFVHLARNNQLRHLWRGFCPALLQSAVTSTAFAVVYEFVKRVSALDDL